MAAVAAKRFDLQTDPVFIRYTTVSQPECVDGWLGMQLSDKLWFPCWNSKVMSDSAARIIPLISSQARAAAALQPASPAPSFNASQALPASPRNAATPTALPLDGSAGKRTQILPLQTTLSQACSRALRCCRLRIGRWPLAQLRWTAATGAPTRLLLWLMLMLVLGGCTESSRRCSPAIERCKTGTNAACKRCRSRSSQTSARCRRLSPQASAKWRRPKPTTLL